MVVGRTKSKALVALGAFDLRIRSQDSTQRVMCLMGEINSWLECVGSTLRCAAASVDAKSKTQHEHNKDEQEHQDMIFNYYCLDTRQAWAARSWQPQITCPVVVYNGTSVGALSPRLQATSETEI
jgi:hypothetical protein